MPERVCIYEDNENLRESLCGMLSLAPAYELAEACANCNEIETQIRHHDPAIILMDIDLPGVGGIEAVKKIRSFNKTVQIIMLTVFDDDDHVFNSLQAGANGYLLKKNIVDKLISSMQEVLNGGAPMSSAIARMIVNKMHQPAEKTDYQLTVREKEILASLSNGNSHKMIASEMQISIDTVRTHLKNIYQKLQVHSQTEVLNKVFNEKLV